MLSLDQTNQNLLQITTKTAQTLGKVFWNLCELWDLSRKDQALLLGVKYHPGKLKSYEDQQIIPVDPDKFNRVGLLAGIHKNLRLLFPYNRRSVYDFMNTKQSFLLGNQTPLEFIRKNGEARSYASLSALRLKLDQLRTSS